MSLGSESKPDQITTTTATATTIAAAHNLFLLKWTSFGLLVLQASGHAIVAKYSRIQQGPKYLASTVVVLCELFKLLFCLAMHYKVRNRKAGQSFWKVLWSDVFGPESDYLKMTVPAIVYFIQNMLLFVAIQYLDPATFHIASQSKILTTALFSIIMLGTHLPPSKWLALFMILVGVCLVQLNHASPTGSTESQNTLIGFAAVFARSTLSGFAGVWFEKALKGKKVSIYLRNIQLSLFSLVPGFLVAVCIMDGAAIRENGFFQGYTAWTWASILFESCGGLLVAVVVKYADSILKVIATTIAFIISSAASVHLFGTHIGFYFILGSCLVLGASQIYILGLPSVLPNFRYSQVKTAEE